MLDVALSGTSTFVVRQDESYRELVEIGAREMVHTRVAVHSPLRSGFPYIDAMHVAVALRNERRAPDALCLGGGGGVIARQLVHFGAQVDVVEISKAVIDLAEKHFGLKSGRSLSIHRSDAAMFVGGSTAARYDVVLVDLFGPFRASPLLASTRFFSNVRRVLRDGGAVAVNTVGALSGDAGAWMATERALATAFGDVIAIPMLSERERDTEAISLSAPRNVVLLATRGPLPNGLVTPYEDDVVPALPVALADAHRRLRALAKAREEAADSTPMHLGEIEASIPASSGRRASPHR